MREKQGLRFAYRDAHVAQIARCAFARIHDKNAVTGDYSRGAAGLWIERGEFVHPVEEVTIAGNLLDMLRGIEMVGDDLEPRSSIAAPTLKISRMTIAGR